MKTKILILSVVVACLVASCDGNAPKPPIPNYTIGGTLPYVIKTASSGPLSALRTVHVHNQVLINVPVPKSVTLTSAVSTAGITLTFPGVSSGRPDFIAPVNIGAPAGLAPGSYPVNVVGISSGISNKVEILHRIKVYGTNDGGAYITLAQSEVDIKPGGTATIRVIANRIPPFAGDATLSFPAPGSKLPKGVSVVGRTNAVVTLSAAKSSQSFLFNLAAEADASGGEIVAAEVATVVGGVTKKDTESVILLVK